MAVEAGSESVQTLLLFAWHLYKREPFFKRRREVADPALLKPSPAIAGGSE